MKDDLISREELIKKITEQYDMQYGNYPLSYTLCHFGVNINKG